MHKRNGNGKDTSESEIIASKRLLSSIVTTHKGLIEVVAYDALACNAPYINECAKLNVDAVIRVKKSHMLTIKKAKRETNKKKSTKKWYDGNHRIKAYESLFNMDGINQQLRYIKFAKKNTNGNRSQVLVVTTSMIISIKPSTRL